MPFDALQDLPSLESLGAFPEQASHRQKTVRV